MFGFIEFLCFLNRAMFLLVSSTVCFPLPWLCRFRLSKELGRRWPICAPHLCGAISTGRRPIAGYARGRVRRDLQLRSDCSGQFWGQWLGLLWHVGFCVTSMLGWAKLPPAFCYKAADSCRTNMNQAWSRHFLEVGQVFDFFRSHVR